MGDFENSFVMEDSFGEISFAFSEPDDQPQSVNIDISNGSVLNSADFSGAHFNINSIRAPGRLEALNDYAKVLSLNFIVITESKLDETIPSSLIELTGFHEPLRRDRDCHGGGCLIYISDNLTFKQQSCLQSEFFQHIWVDIRVNDKIFSLNTLYRPPN